MRRFPFLLKFLLPLFIFFLLPIPMGLFFDSVEAVPPMDFSSQKPLLEEALREAEAQYAALEEGEDLSQPRQKILFFRTALDFSLPVWQSDFYFESASVYAAILREWEILNAYPSPETLERKAYLEKEEQTLKEILEKKSIPDYLNFYKEFLLHENTLSQKEIEREISSLEKKFLATEDGTLTSGESDVLYHIRAIEESLEDGVQRYHPAYAETPLTQRDRTELARLHSYLLKRLEKGEIDPIPANSETLRFLEGIGAFLTFTAFTFLSLRMEKKYSKKEFLLLFLFSFSALFAGLLLSAHLFAPTTLTPTPICLFGSFYPLPAPLGILFRTFLSLLGYLPFFLLAHWIKKKTERSVFYTLCPPLVALLYEMIGILFCLWMGRSPLLHLLPFVYTDLKGAFLPDYPFYLPQSLSPILVAAVFSILCFFLFRRIRAKIKEEKPIIEESPS